jgi:predicted flap endonuclease-1-like 5' DNA nuclease
MLAADRTTATGLARQRFINLRRAVADALIRHGIRSWRQVAAATDDELLAIRGIGPATLVDIRRDQWLEGF